MTFPDLINFLPPGEAFVLIGQTGCGKTFLSVHMVGQYLRLRPETRASILSPFLYMTGIDHVVEWGQLNGWSTSINDLQGRLNLFPLGKEGKRGMGKPSASVIQSLVESGLREGRFDLFALAGEEGAFGMGKPSASIVQSLIDSGIGQRDLIFIDEAHFESLALRQLLATGARLLMTAQHSQRVQPGLQDLLHVGWMQGSENSLQRPLDIGHVHFSDGPYDRVHHFVPSADEKAAYALGWSREF